MAIALNHTSCDTEPIHTPGAIQPFGVLLACEINSLTVGHVSENCREVLGVGPANLLGRSIADLLGTAADAALRQALVADGLIDHRAIPVQISDRSVSRWHARAHCLGGKVFVEIESLDRAARSAVDDHLAAVRLSVARLSRETSIAEFCATMAREVRALTGYDRVMVYRFDPDWNGEVVAEERREDLEPFLGLHYPATDIPAPARALYLLNRIRIIADAAYEPVTIVPSVDSRTGLPLDLSRCLLRSASPIHREYLHNMGVKASLTASLIVAGRLWGMIACHHATPRYPSPAERGACDLIAQMASAQIAFLTEVEDREYLALLTEALGRTRTRIGSTTPPIAALAKDTGDLLALVGAGGAVLWRSGRSILVGRTPPETALPELIHWIRSVPSSLIATDRLSEVYAPARQFAADASGLLALEVSRQADEYLLWFRPEVLQSIHWGGDPRSKAGPDGRLTPRQSFAIWKESVQARSLPWRPAEVENARQVKDLLLTAAAMSAVRLEGLLPICAWCKKIRDEPGYWRGVEEFIHDLVDVRFTHGVCPDCMQQQMAQLHNH